MHKYLQKEYSMTDDEIEGLNKMCKFKEELGKKDSAKRKSESTKEDTFGINAEENPDDDSAKVKKFRSEWIRRSYEC